MKKTFDGFVFPDIAQQPYAVLLFAAKDAANQNVFLSDGGIFRKRNSRNRRHGPVRKLKQ